MKVKMMTKNFPLIREESPNQAQKDLNLAQTMSTIIAVCLCLYVCLGAGLGDIPICSSKQQETVRAGDNAHLSCHLYEKLHEKLSVLWKKTEGGADIVVHEQNNGKTSDNQSSAYFNRTTMFKDWLQRKDATLHVDGVRPEDAGDYSCWIIQSQLSPATLYRCCTITLQVAKEWKGDMKQLVVAWSLYIGFLSLLVYFLSTCRQQKSPPDKIYEV